MKKPVFYTEIAYGVGLLLLSLATALMERGGLGMSIVVAPAYVVHLKLSSLWSWFTFGTAECISQALVLVLMLVLVGRVRVTWLLTVLTTLLYSIVLDGCMALTASMPAVLWVRVIAYVGGFVLCVTGVGLMLRAYFPPTSYDLFSKLVSAARGKPLSRVKTTYDLTCLALALGLSLWFFGEVRGVGIGTVFGALLGGTCIRWTMVWQERVFAFRDRLPWRKYFE